MMIADKKSLIVIFIAITLCWIIGDRLLAQVINTKVLPKSGNRFSKVYTGRGYSDVVMLGNSRLDRHFDPELLSIIYNKSVINLGIGGQSTKLSLMILEDFIDRYGSPKVVILEASNAFVDMEGLKDLKPFSFQSDRIANLMKTYLPSEYSICRFSNLYNFNSTMFYRIIFEIFKENNKRLRNGTISEGQYRHIFEPDVGDRSEITWRNRNLEAFNHIITICKEKNIDLKVIVTPHLGMISNRDRYSKWLTDLKLRSPVYDLSDRIQERKYYFDENHLNQKGVLKLYELLKAEGFFSIDQ